MLGKFEFNIQEYISIRSEMCQRISVINAQSHTAILTIITAFGAGITLNYNAQVDKIDNMTGFISLNIIRCLIVFISVSSKEWREFNSDSILICIYKSFL